MNNMRDDDVTTDGESSTDDISNDLSTSPLAERTRSLSISSSIELRTRESS